MVSLADECNSEHIDRIVCLKLWVSELYKCVEVSGALIDRKAIFGTIVNGKLTSFCRGYLRQGVTEVYVCRGALSSGCMVLTWYHFQNCEWQICAPGECA